jgi:4-alpha-glucanotransferase
MNRPATTNGNWGWRVLTEQLGGALAAKLAETTALYGRIPEAGKRKLN